MVRRKENKKFNLIKLIGLLLFACGMFMIVYKYDFSLISIIWTVVLECIYNVFIATILFRPFSFLAEIINKGKKSYYLL